MKKIQILVLVLLGFFAIRTQAQIKVSATIGPQIPMGTFGDAFKTGFGFNVSGMYMVTESIGAGLNIGYNSFKGKLEGTKGSMMPITLFGQYFFGTGPVKAFAGLDLGLYSYKVKIDFMGVTGTDSKTYFGFAPTVGALYTLNDKISLCGNLKYNYVTTDGDAATWLGINLGAIFTLPSGK